MPEDEEKKKEEEVKLVDIYVMGKRYKVPEGLTIMTALEYAGYKYVRGCGCRGGFCRCLRYDLQTRGRVQVEDGPGVSNGGQGRYVLGPTSLRTRCPGRIRYR